MLRKNSVLLVLFVVLAALAFSSIVLADQVEDPAENWCYEGGPWGDGRCTVPNNPALTEWYWTCGYYRAQVINGTYSVSQIPLTCQAPIREIRNVAASVTVTPPPVTVTPPPVTVTPPPVTVTPPPVLTASWSFCVPFIGGANTLISFDSPETLGTISFTSDETGTLSGLTLFQVESWGAQTYIIPGGFSTLSNASITNANGTATLGSRSCS